MLLGQPEAGRSDEGAAGGDDWAVTQGDPGLVPEQEVQGQEDSEQDDGEAVATGKCESVIQFSFPFTKLN